MPFDGGAAGGQGATGTTGGNGGGAGTGQGAGTGSYAVNNGGATGGQSGQGSGGATGGGGYESARERRSSGASEIVERLLHRYGNAERALEHLAGDNFDLRDERRTLAERLATIERQLPPNGAVVLVGDDVKAWEGYKALNLAPDKVKERLTNEERLVAETTRAQVGTLAQQAAQSYGWNADALGELIADKAITLEMRDATVSVNGKQEVRKMPFARKTSDTTAPLVPLSEYVERNHKIYVPALVTKPQGGASTGASGSGTPAAQGATGATGGATSAPATSTGAQGAPVILSGDTASGQPATGGAPNPVDRLLAANKAAAAEGNPLRPKQG